MARYDRLIEKIDPNQVYTVDFTPRDYRAPSYDALGRREARLGNYVTGDAVRKVAKRYGNSKYDEHYGLNILRVNTNGVGMDRIREVAEANGRNLNKLYDNAMRDISDMYKKAGGYGPEWYYENQPKGGFYGNSPY